MGCPTGNPPVGTVHYWQGDSASVSITRAQDNQKIYCFDKQFDQYTCALTKDLADYHQLLIESCTSWATKEQWLKFAEGCVCGKR